VPDLVEGLGDVNESSGTELMSINGVVDDPNETMDLFERRVLRSEAELMERYYFGMVDQGKESDENKFFKDFGRNG
jgi:hypothetical protein